MGMKLLRWAVVLAVVGWLGSVAVSASARYLELSDVIERVVVDVRPAGGIPDTGKAMYLRRVQAQIVSRAGRPNAPLTEEGVLVTAAPGSLWVTVRWSHPVLTWNGQTLWALPLSLSRTFSNTL
jgi:hypothetical protein